MWKVYQPVGIIFGEGEVDRIAEHMKQAGLSRGLILSDPFPAVLAISEQIKNNLGDNALSITSDVEPNPTIQNVDNCASLARNSDAQCLIAIGGGSTIDCAKLAAVAAKMGCTAKDIINGQAITGGLPVIAIPTTAGTGSEVTAVTIVSDTESGDKVPLVNPAYFPKLAIVDPKLTYSCPKGVTASSGIDVLMHAFDAMSSVKAGYVTDALAMRAAKIVFDDLETVVKNGDDIGARERMSAASLLAGLAFAQTGTTGSHACSYYLTARYHVPHGEACAFTAAEWLKINVKGRPQLDVYAKELGFKDVNDMAGALQKLNKAIGMRTTLEEVGIEESDMEEICRKTATAANAPNNVVPITTEMVMDILRTK